MILLFMLRKEMKIQFSGNNNDESNISIEKTIEDSRGDSL